jgi:hypothetical protein
MNKQKKEKLPYFDVKGYDKDTLSVDVERFFIRSDPEKIIILMKILEGNIIPNKKIKLVSEHNGQNFLEVIINEIQVNKGVPAEKATENQVVGIHITGISKQGMREFNKKCEEEFNDREYLKGKKEKVFPL